MKEFKDVEVDPFLRYQVVRDGFWWKIKVGSGSWLYGRFFTKVGAMRMAELLRSEFLNGEFVYRVKLETEGDQDEVVP